MRDFLNKYPEVKACLDSLHETSKEIRSFIVLVAEIAYREGVADGMKQLMDYLLNNRQLAWLALFTMAQLALEASDWPYGVATRIFR